MDSKPSFPTAHSLFFASFPLPKTLGPELCLHCYRSEAVSFFLGIVIHLCLFRRGEWDLAVVSICKIYMLTFLLLLSLFIITDSDVSLMSGVENVRRTWALLLAHGLGLGVSITGYRYWFHRLRDFPGPALAGISSFYMVGLGIRYHQSETLQDYHRKYGDFVRICKMLIPILLLNSC